MVFTTACESTMTSPKKDELNFFLKENKREDKALYLTFCKDLQEIPPDEKQQEREEYAIIYI